MKKLIKSWFILKKSNKKLNKCIKDKNKRKYKKVRSMHESTQYVHWVGDIRTSNSQIN